MKSKLIVISALLQTVFIHSSTGPSLTSSTVPSSSSTPRTKVALKSYFHRATTSELSTLSTPRTISLECEQEEIVSENTGRDLLFGLIEQPASPWNLVRRVRATAAYVFGRAQVAQIPRQNQHHPLRSRRRNQPTIEFTPPPPLVLNSRNVADQPHNHFTHVTQTPAQPAQRTSLQNSPLSQHNSPLDRATTQTPGTPHLQNDSISSAPSYADIARRPARK